MTLRTNFSSDEQSTLNNSGASRILLHKEPVYRGASVIPNSIDTQPLWNRTNELNKFGNNSYVPQKPSPNTREIQEEINIPNWENFGENTINLRNTFETNLSALNILNKLESLLNQMNCDVTLHRAKGEISGRKFNEKTYDVTSFKIFLCEHNSQIRVKMIRNGGCSFTFQTLLFDTFKHMESFATEIDPIFRKPLNTQTFGPLPTMGLKGLEDFDMEWTEQDIISIIDELENGYHQSIQTSCIELAKESSSSNDFLQKLCAIEHVIERFVRITSESHDVLVVRNILTVLKNIWNYFHVQSDIYNDFLDSLETKWGKPQTMKLGPNEWVINKSFEVLRIITESRNVLRSS